MSSASEFEVIARTFRSRLRAAGGLGDGARDQAAVDLGLDPRSTVMTAESY